MVCVWCIEIREKVNVAGYRERMWYGTHIRRNRVLCGYKRENGCSI